MATLTFNLNPDELPPDQREKLEMLKGVIKVKTNSPKFEYCEIVHTAGASGRLCAKEWTNEWGWVYSVDVGGEVSLFPEHQLEGIEQ